VKFPVGGEEGGGEGDEAVGVGEGRDEMGRAPQQSAISTHSSTAPRIVW